MNVAIPPEFRLWINEFMDELPVSGLALAKRATVNRTWLQQVLSGARAKRVNRESLIQIKNALLEIVAEKNPDDEEKQKGQRTEIEEQFYIIKGFDGNKVLKNWDTKMCNQYAADLFASFLEDDVPVEQMSTILDFLAGTVGVHQKLCVKE